MNALWIPSLPLAQIFLRAAVTYAFVLFLLRLGGKRQIGQMGPAEFVALLLVSNAVQNSMNGGDNSITGGLVLAGVIVGMSSLVGWLSFRSKRLSDFIQGRPVLLAYKGEIVVQNLDKCRIAARELHVLLRHQGVHELRDVHEAVLETNGSLSVVKNSDLAPASRA
ncbi:MAG: DUF421 domain-containing protein [Elusimicrobia bacterium]|nr:DUF421 domain-containing protein [Elusimicrobiota bacterium]